MINPQLGGAITNDAWITKNDVPDPEVLPDLPGYHVLVRPTSIKEKNKFLAGAWCKEGDYVCYQKLSGTKFVYKGVKLLLLFDDQVLMRISDPEDLDTTLVLGN